MILLLLEHYIIRQSSKQLPLITLLVNFLHLFLMIQQGREELTQIQQWVSHGFIKTGIGEQRHSYTLFSLMALVRVS